MFGMVSEGETSHAVLSGPYVQTCLLAELSSCLVNWVTIRVAFYKLNAVV